MYYNNINYYQVCMVHYQSLWDDIVLINNLNGPSFLERIMEEHRGIMSSQGITLFLVRDCAKMCFDSLGYGVFTLMKDFTFLTSEFSDGF